MFGPFFVLAAQSPTRHQAFLQLMAVHVGLLLVAFWALAQFNPSDNEALGHTALITGIVEGAILLGWRLTQMPKSQALEFILVSQLQPWRVFLAEAAVGIARLGLLTLAGLPVYLFLVQDGRLLPVDIIPLLALPFTFGVLTGVGLTSWAYEPVGVRKWGERVFMAGLIAYLVVGVLAAEHILRWAEQLPEGVSKSLIFGSILTFHEDNPFGMVHLWMTRYGMTPAENALVWRRFLVLEGLGLLAGGLFLARGAFRLHGHFHDRHYKPIQSDTLSRVDAIGDRPLSWWAVQRVMEYSGRINLYVAGGFGAVYALYIVLVSRDAWPDWLGQKVFQLVEAAGGIPGVATALVVLAAVPAAYQYGLWDSNAHERCRRLELLLLTGLEGVDYWRAAWAAAWRRGRGYFLVAVVLGAAAVIAGRASVLQTVGGLAAGVILWGLYFALGFRAFSKGLYANNLGFLLTVGFPGLTYALNRGAWPQLAWLLPPGAVYGALAGQTGILWGLGPVLAGGLMLLIAHLALTGCDRDLRAWYDTHHGRAVGD